MLSLPKVIHKLFKYCFNVQLIWNSQHILHIISSYYSTDTFIHIKMFGLHIIHIFIYKRSTKSHIKMFSKNVFILYILYNTQLKQKPNHKKSTFHFNYCAICPQYQICI